ncbi:SLOG family protein [Micromonospora sediminicola]|uniref:SLOG family protein n=1 Tax=Micromonospora sediminicola TaxID=946078 RepID=UPI0037A6883B
MATETRLLVTGSRTFGPRTTTWDGRTVGDVLDATAVDAARAGHAGLIVVQGACSEGADKVADGWAEERRAAGWPVVSERHKAQWRKYQKRAGFIRNELLVSLGAHRCAAFIDACIKPKCRNKPLHGSHGAEHCAGLAEHAGIPTTRFYTAVLHEALAVAAPVTDLSARRDDAANH